MPGHPFRLRKRATAMHGCLCRVSEMPPASPGRGFGLREMAAVTPGRGFWLRETAAVSPGRGFGLRKMTAGAPGRGFGLREIAAVSPGRRFWLRKMIAVTPGRGFPLPEMTAVHPGSRFRVSGNDFIRKSGGGPAERARARLLRSPQLRSRTMRWLLNGVPPQSGAIRTRPKGERMRWKSPAVG